LQLTRMVLNPNRRRPRRGLRRKRQRRKMMMMRRRLKKNRRRRHLGSVNRLLLNQNLLKRSLRQRSEGRLLQLQKRKRSPRNLPKSLRRLRRKTQNRRNQRKPQLKRTAKQKLLRKPRNQKIKIPHQPTRKTLNLLLPLLQNPRRGRQMKVKPVRRSQ